MSFVPLAPRWLIVTIVATVIARIFNPKSPLHCLNCFHCNFNPSQGSKLRHFRLHCNLGPNKGLSFYAIDLSVGNARRQNVRSLVSNTPRMTAAPSAHPVNLNGTHSFLRVFHS
ncbi:uncharacterized protein B0J16DRAFT_185727 [Fusarium flagelliforme]|uniref:uncharacterized protein n=1 Tax=Fusarium flagelliforme TaxID=2675880 RepID=UPI001E8CA2F3|nr:uncharacterized protein B0J16DRAFT_185727 [Fusarium flagelliforme]KAH7174853.1 hypothetical protein B0J16DRAFT_185727 [Fusarium flagelliforme]